ncbi:hypothetical protein I6N91_05065 [Arthrobacter sp. MSA 4-2]|uniref:hypothetical protein n=1 Tax=Arthrobacter sp. MSA 4-2 TaxID=2794349 RepID=UPI0018E707D5|nr:hypothetical protein [Arthrobacter sp. MSA 4-2]MBJ2120347.1 hypothetical protein [Arthrobacter sp. MSA 4-2]
METLIAGDTITVQPWLIPTDAMPVEKTHADPLLCPASEEEFEWMAYMTGCRTDWYDLKSLDRFVEVINMTSRNGDWSVIQSKNLDHRTSGRYVQVMNIGSAYHVEVASKEDEIIRNWRIGLGTEADDAGNEPYSPAVPTQQLPFTAVTEVLDSWLRGHGIPLGYGAALHVYG